MSLLGQKAKYPRRAHVFRFTSDNGHAAAANDCFVPIVFSNSGSGCQVLHDHPCRAHCSLRGRGKPSA